jgi:hypothetical protein
LLKSPLTFVDFDRLCKLEKRGDEIKKKSSPLKLLSQFQPNYAEMILAWSPSKIVSGIHTSDQCGCHSRFHQSFVAIDPVISAEKIFM